MRLVPRLLLLGVVAPTAAILVSSIVASQLFRQSLLRELDERLYALAAVEAVSLFDGPGNTPHLHVPKPPVRPDGEFLPPQRTLYDNHGTLIAESSPEASIGIPYRRGIPGEPQLIAEPTEHFLIVGIERPGEGVYTLILRQSLAQADKLQRALNRTLALTTAASVVLLGLLLGWQARRLSRRVGDISGFVPMLRGAHEKPHEARPGTDELTELNTALKEAADVIAAQRAAQDRWLANAAHQLRTPLAVLCAELDLGLRKPRTLEELHEVLANARSEADQLSATASKLLDFEALRTQELKRRPLDVAALLDEVKSRHASASAARSITLTVEAQELPGYLGDAFLLSQALGNMLENAIRFAPTGSVVRVRGAVEGLTLALSVADDGPGIPDDERGKVFEPFFRGRTEGSQSGLGLAYVAEVARRHRGSVAIDDVPKGTRVTLRLPLSEV